MKCVKVELKAAENVRKDLLKQGVFSKDYESIRDKSYVYFPVTENINSYKIVNKKLEKKENHRDIKEVLKGKLKSKELELLFRGYETVGNIAIVELDKDLESKSKLIAEALLKCNKNIKTVVKKIGRHEGEFRIQDYEYLGGEKTFEVLYKESGVIVKFDLRRTYFSTKLNHDRLRIASLIKTGENVLVMFSGVGIYPLIISKHSKAKEIYGVEINPAACKFAEENVKINKISNIKLYCGDVNKIVPEIDEKFDRILMPLPWQSRDFLGLALKYLNKNGIIHFYCFASDEEIKEVIKFIKSKCKCEILNQVKCGQQSPRKYRFCIDFTVL